MTKKYYRYNDEKGQVEWVGGGNFFEPITDELALKADKTELGSAVGADLVQSTGSSEHDVMSQKAVTDALDTKANLNQPGTMGLGVGQTWQDMRSNRSMGTTYTNTTGRTILVSVSLRLEHSSSYSVFGINSFVDGVLINRTRASSTVTNIANYISSVIAVPPGSTYRADHHGSDDIDDVSLNIWVELR